MAADTPARTPRAVIASGAGRYDDPWHPFATTSAIVADILGAAGWDATVVADPDAALTVLDGADLLVVNAGDPWAGGDARRGADPAAAAGLHSALESGVGMLALHSALSSLRDYPDWRSAIGGAWIDGRSWHPEIGPARVRAVGPLVEHDLAVFDEVYTDLEVAPGIVVHAVHDLEGTAHPVIWTLESGGARAAVSALGHDVRVYESSGYRGLIVHLARWAARLDDVA